MKKGEPNKIDVAHYRGRCGYKINVPLYTGKPRNLGLPSKAGHTRKNLPRILIKVRKKCSFFMGIFA